MSGWNRFWFRDTQPEGYALFRMAFGAALLVYFGSFAPHVATLFSSEGVYVPFLLPDLAPGPIGAWILWGATIVAASLFTLGWRTKWITPLLLVLFAHHYFVSFGIKDTAYDRLFLIFLAVACFAPLDRKWALRRTEGATPVFAARLLCFQVAALYFGAGMWKLFNEAWHTGDMMRMTMVGPWGTELARAFVLLELSPTFWTALTWSVIVFEVAAGILVFVPYVRGPVLLAAAAFHLGVWAFLQIPEFLVCLAVYPLFFEQEPEATP